MQLVSFSVDQESRRRIGILHPDHVAEVASGDLLALLQRDRALQQLLAEEERAGGFHYPLSIIKLHAPITRPGKIICVGLNYRDHAEEQNKALPKAPMLFAKYANAIVGPHDDIMIPPDTQAVDYEAELAVVIGYQTKGVSMADALGCIAGYMIMNDVTARDFQRADGQFTRGKTQDTFAPIGPALVTPDEIADPHALAIRCWVNEELRQDSNTNQLIFNIPYLISYISRGITLEPGDIIATGTPGGVGEHRQPPAFLKAGDCVRIEVEGVGRIENRVVSSNRE